MTPPRLAALEAATALPADGAGTLVGRAWIPGDVPGPSVVAIRGDEVVDLSADVATMTDLCNATEPSSVAHAGGRTLGKVGDVLANSAHDARDPGFPWFLAPVDLQVVKASGVTFAESLLERVIEEQAGGDKHKAEEIRHQIVEVIGVDLSQIEPGSPSAMELKAHLIEQGAWSQYLEVGIGPDAEVFTKAAPLSSVGTGSKIGVRPDSGWNNPEPELVMIVSGRGAIVGATLGNDVNLRDLEGRSALLLGKAKDNNASSALGPFIRLVDDSLTLDDLKKVTIELRVEGEDGYELVGTNSMRHISRDIEDLVAATIDDHHQYPDGLALYAGTMFAPTADRDASGEGFTHKVGDVVEISCPELGTLVNVVDRTDVVEPWTFGIGELMRNLSARGLLDGAR